MPSAVPTDAAVRLPKARMIDPRGHRFGAGVSAILLVVAFLTGTPWLVALVFVSIGVSARVRPALLDLRRDLAADRQGRPPGPDRARARVPAAVRPGPRSVGADPVARLVPARRDHLGWLFALAVAGAADPAGRRRATAWAAVCTSCAGGCRTSVTRLWTRGASRANRLAVEPIRN